MIDFDQMLYCFQSTDNYYIGGVVWMKDNKAIYISERMYPENWIRAHNYSFNPRFTRLDSVAHKDHCVVVKVLAGDHPVTLACNDAVEFLRSWWEANLPPVWNENIDDVLYFQKMEYRARIVMVDGRTIVITGDAYEKFWKWSTKFWHCGDYYFNPDKTKVETVKVGNGAHWLEVTLSVGVTLYDDDAANVLCYS